MERIKGPSVGLLSANHAQWTPERHGRLGGTLTTFHLASHWATGFLLKNSEETSLGSGSAGWVRKSEALQRSVVLAPKKSLTKGLGQPTANTGSRNRTLKKKDTTTE